MSITNQNNLREKAYQHIRRRVFNGEFPPGTRLVNRTLASEIGSSFIPVREAISRLASEGLVQQVAGAGAFVRSVDRQEISEIYDVRGLVEPFAASQAARLMTDHELNELQALLRDWESLAETILHRKRGATSSDLDRWLDYNERFHSILISASRNRLLGKIMNDVHLLSLCFTSQRGSPRLLTRQLVQSTIKTHRQLLRSLEKHDSKGAEAVVRVQLRTGKEVGTSILRQSKRPKFMNHFKSYLVSLLWFVVFIFGCRIHAFAEEKPNVLLIVSEDNSEQIGCYGDRRVTTPYLDSLAATGVRYDRAYVPYSVCSPSRAAFLTSLYTRQTGHFGLATHNFAMYRYFKTMPAYLQEAGYYTGFTGKTHINPESLVENFVDFRGVSHSNFSNTHSIEDYAQEARTIFENAQKENKPFLAIINYSDAHRRFIGNSPAGYPTVKVTGDIDPLPWIGVDTPYLRKEMRNYLNCMNRLDEGIGMVLEDLDELEVRDNTLIIYMADHGADFPRSKTSCYEAGVKVPMIVNFPKSFPTGSLEPSMVSTMDILPTILQEVGIPIPDELMGTPLQALLDPATPRRKYIHTFNTGASAHLLYLTFGIHGQRYKLIYNPVRAQNPASISRYQNSEIPESLWMPEYVDPPEFELYDLETDPHEFNNLARDPAYGLIRNRLFKTMQEFQEEIKDPFLDPANVEYYMKEMKDPSRHPQRRTDETWGHLKRFYGNRNSYD